MARLPTPGADNDIWGNVLNEFLSESLSPDGTLKSGVVAAAQVQNGTITTPKLAGEVQATLASAMSEITLDKQWIITGPINVAAGDVDYIAPAYITIPAGFNAVLTTVRARINSGTSANIRMTKNGSNLSGLTSLTVTPAGVVANGLNLVAADADLLAPVVNSTSGSPQNMTVMISYKLTKI